MNDEGLVVTDETPFKKLEMSEREIGRSRMKHRVDRFVNLVEKKETREREKVIQILAAGNNIQNIEQITGRFVSNLYKQNKQRLLVGA